MSRPAVLGRAPITVGAVALVLVLAVLTHALWDPVADRPLREAVGYGLPAVEQGRWWTVLLGLPFALHPAEYLPLIVGLVVLGGFAEWRLGSRLFVALALGLHLVAVAATIAFLQLTRDHGWGWATQLSHLTDVGIASGFLGAAACASATLPVPWRGRSRVALSAYVLVALLYMGSMADVEHAFAVLFGLAAGPLLLRRMPRLEWHPLTRRGYRGLAAGFLAVSGVAAAMNWFAPVSGPLATTLSEEAQRESVRVSHSVPLGTIAQTLILLWLARSVWLGRRRAWAWSVAVTALLTLILVLSAIGLAVEHEPGWPVIVYEVLLNLGGLWVLLAGRRAFRNPSPRRARRAAGGTLHAAADEGQRDTARALLEREGTVNRLAWMTTWPENRWFSTDRYAGYVAYRIHAGVAIGLCDPVAASPSDRSALLAAFAESASRDALVPCLFSITAEGAGHARALGWQAVQVAQEAVIDLPSLQFRGKAWQDVRTALNQAAKQEMTFRLGALADQPRGIQIQVRAISTGWVEEKGLPEMGFTLGGVDEALDPRVRVGLAVAADGTVHGVTSWMPIHADGGELTGWTLDVMRRLPGGFRYTMEYLISSSCLAFQEEGCRWVSLSGAPLARTPSPDGVLDRGSLDAFLDRLGAALEPYYGFRSLHDFKAKFQPQFHPLYLVFPDESALPRIGVALSRAYLPQAGLREIRALARSGG